jgi:hypothetical protein
VQSPSKFADECVRLALTAETASARRKLLLMAKAWLEVGQLLEERAPTNDAVDRMWEVMAAKGLIRTPR